MLAAAPVMAWVTPGLPVAVRIFSESVLNRVHDGDEDLEQPLPSSSLLAAENGGATKEIFDVPFTNKSKLTDLQVLLVDSCENVVNMKKLHDRVKDMILKVSGRAV